MAESKDKGTIKVTPEQILRTAAGVGLPGESVQKPGIVDLTLGDVEARQNIARAKRELERRLEEEGQ